MINTLLTKSKKSLFLTATGIFALAATAQAYQAEEQAYMIQGASPSTMINLVESVGGEVLQDITLTGAISASLTEQEVLQLQQQHSLLRFDGAQTNDELAGFIWGKLGKKGKKLTDEQVNQDDKVAGFIWGKLGKKGKKFTDEQVNQDDKVAGFIWGKLGKKGKKFTDEQINQDNKVAGFIWGKLGKKGKKFTDEQINLDNKVAGFIWGKLGKKGKKIVA